jgi:hypothetical protein
MPGRSRCVEPQGRRARLLKGLAEDVGGDLQGVSGLLPWQLENLAEHVCEPVWPSRHCVADEAITARLDE